MGFTEFIKMVIQKIFPAVKKKAIEKIKQWNDLDELKSKIQYVLDRKAKENDMLKQEYAQMEEYVTEHMEDIIASVFYEKNYKKRANNYECFCDTVLNFISIEEEAGIKNEVKRTMEELLAVIGNHLREHHSEDQEQTLNTNLMIDEIHKLRLQERKEITSEFQRFVDGISYSEQSNESFHYLNDRIGFYGREKEFLYLDEFCRAERDVMFTAITGQGGIGKSN